MIQGLLRVRVPLRCLLWGALAFLAVAHMPRANADAALQRQLEALVVLAPDRPDEALKGLHDLEAQARVGSFDDQREFLSALGYTQARSGDSEGAHRTAEELTRLGTRAKSELAQMEGLLVRTEALFGDGRYVEANTLAAQAANRSSASATPQLRFWLGCLRGSIATELGHPDEALRHYQEVEQVAEALKEPRRQTLVQHNLARLYLQVRQPDQAMKSLDHAWKLASGRQDLLAMANLKLTEAEIRSALGQAAQQRAALFESLSLGERLHAESIQSAALINLSDYYLKSGDLQAAIQHALRAQQLVRGESDWAGSAVIQSNLGLARILSGQIETGRKSVEAALEVFHSRQAVAEEAAILREYGEALKHAGQPEDALHVLERERDATEALFRSQRQRALLELQTRYESERQQRAIERLNQENALKTAELENQTLQRRISWLASLALALAAALIGVFYHRARETNRHLTERNAELAVQSCRDPLTGLYNRRYFQQQMEIEERNKVAPKTVAGRCHALYLIDLDHFKRINDRLGHASGDAVLVEVAERLRRELPEADMIVRWGGEEFLVHVPDRDQAQIDEIARRIIGIIALAPVDHAGSTIPVTASVGYAAHPLLPGRIALSWQRRLNLIDMALYLAKAHGRSRAYGIRSVQGKDAESIAAIEKDLEVAWAENRVELEVFEGPPAQPVA